MKKTAETFWTYNVLIILPEYFLMSDFSQFLFTMQKSVRHLIHSTFSICFVMSDRLYQSIQNNDLQNIQ